jgi:hypothetical protein
MAEISRREFATLGGSFLLSSFLAGCVESAGSHGIVSTTPKAAARLLSSLEEQLPDGSTRRTIVVAWDSLPPHGVSTVATNIETRTPTPTGDILQYEITFTPALAMATAGRSSSALKIRYEFTYGPVQEGGEMRQDTVVMRSVIDGVATPPRTARVLRPVVPTHEFAQLSPRERLARAVEMFNTEGHISKDMPGAWRVVETSI